MFSMPAASGISICSVGVKCPPAPQDILARVGVAAADLPALCRELRAEKAIREAMVISTCQRVEILAACLPHVDLPGLLRRHPKLACVPPELWSVHRGLDAVHHTIRLCSGLDSAVVGENEIVAQIKTAYSAAQAAHSIGKHLHPFVQFCLESAKWIRREHGLETRVAPLGSRIAELIHDRQTAGQLPSEPSALILGAGEVASSVLSALLKFWPGKLALCNRTRSRAEQLARSERARQPIEVVDLADLPQAARQAHVIIAAAQSEHEMLHAEDLTGQVCTIVIDVGLRPCADVETLKSAGIDYINRKLLDRLTRPTPEQLQAISDAERSVNRHVVAFQAEMLGTHAKSLLHARRPAMAEAIKNVIAAEAGWPSDDERLERLERKLYFLFSREIEQVLTLQQMPEATMPLPDSVDYHPACDSPTPPPTAPLPAAPRLATPIA